MKLKKTGGEWFYANFKYEFAPTFCFICGLIGHSENFCPKLFDTPEDEIVKPYGSFMRAQPRRKNYLLSSQYLRTGTEADEQFNHATPVRHDEEDDRPAMQTGKLPCLEFENNPQSKVIDDSPDLVDDGNIPLNENLNHNGNKTNVSKSSINERGKSVVFGNHVPSGKGQPSLFLGGIIGPHGGQGGRGPSTESKRRRQHEGVGGPDYVDMEAEDSADMDVNGLSKNEFEDVMERVRAKLKFEGMFAVDVCGRSGGVALLWRHKEDVKVLNYATNFVDVEVRSTDVGEWRLTGFYGESKRNLRGASWEQLRTLARGNTLPWCVIGDMNNVLSQEDKKGGHPYPNWLVDGFRDTIQECGLIDLDIVGHQFTWEKSRGTDNWIEVRLDRALVTDRWLQLFPRAKLINLEVSSSDHCPIFLDLVRHNIASGSRKFRFENCWLREPLCYQVVKECWEEYNLAGIQEKIQRCGESLSVWGKDYSGNFASRIKYWKKEVRRWKQGRDPDAISKYKEAETELFEVLTQKEVFWRQRSKQLWLQEGDKNSKFFHATASSRRRMNAIDKLQCEDGSWVDWESGLSDVMCSYFQNLFTSSNCTMDDVLDGISATVTSTQNDSLLQPLTDEEVKDALFQMHPDKSPGPDGMTPGFYQKCWAIVGNDVIKQVRSFFLFGQLPTGLNHTNLVLIPKKKNATTMGDLRPIALCNVLYKVCSKVLANRLKHVLPTVISENQSAFIPGRLITDNIMISFEVMHYLKRKRVGKEGYMALKLDMSKAYDRVEWLFLKNIMLKMGFDARVVDLILHCVSTVSYTITHGGREMGPIVPGRGIRQGDPLSPYLFLLCAEGFSSLIKRFEARGALHGCRVCNGAPIISHMLFADDCYIYCKAIEREARSVLLLLQLFEQASGQCVNYSKSTIFFSLNTTSASRQDMCNLLRMNEAPKNSLYLGLPCIMGRNKNAILGFLKDKMQKRIQSWEGRLLSKAGKEVLIKTVAQSLPTYAMSVFLLPVETCNKLEGMMSKYWWSSGSNQNRGVSWVSWRKLCRHKHHGGLGFRDLRDFNLAMLGKQAWRLVTNAHSLVSRVYKARYYPQGSFLSASLGPNPSFIWKSIFETQALIKEGARRGVGPGTNVSVQFDPWLADESQPWVTSRATGMETWTVNNLMVVGERAWDLEVVSDIFNDRDKEIIIRTNIDQETPMDTWYWHKDLYGFYTVREAYRLLHHSEITNTSEAEIKIWKIAWKLRVPPKVHQLMWRALSGCLATKDQLTTKHITLDQACPMCNQVPETIYHLLVQCSFARSCWHLSVLNWSHTPMESFWDWFSHILLQHSSTAQEELLMVLWAIWYARNEVVWRDKSMSAAEVILLARVVLNQWRNAQQRRMGSLLVPTGSREDLEHWVKPVMGKIKVNVDGAIFASDGRFGAAGVARDSQGRFIEGFTVLRVGRVDSAMAELVGVKEALSWIKRKHWGPVDLETDSLVVVQAVQSTMEIPSPFGLQVAVCRSLLADLPLVSINFVKRSVNKAAHCLARSSCLYSDRIFSEDDVPPDFLSIVVVESSY
ncbi:hypothetical protein CsatA_020462 [Cannabis sativa]